MFERTISPVEILTAKDIIPDGRLIYTSASNIIALQSPAMSNARTSVALCAIGPLFHLHTPSSPHCNLRVFETYCNLNLMNVHTSTLPYVLYISQYVLKTIPYCRFYIRFATYSYVYTINKHLILTYPPQSYIKCKLDFLVLT